MFGVKGRFLVTSSVFLSFLLTGLSILFFLPLNPVHNQVLQASAPQGSQFRVTLINLVLNLSLVFGLTLGFVSLLINALVGERQSRQKLAIAHEHLRHYMQRIEDQAALQERNRIAREIHDALGHNLTAQSILLENALMFLDANADPSKVRPYLTEAKQLGSTALTEVRQSVASLRSDPLQGQSLEAAIAGLVARFQSMTGLTPNCHIDLPKSLPLELRIGIYRIIQEALTNSCKHSRAQHVWLQIQEHEKGIFVSIIDDGIGFTPEHNTRGSGLLGMRERTTQLDGELSIESHPGGGCKITALIPLRLTL
jgi:signal transduction histidine kinase